MKSNIASAVHRREMGFEPIHDYDVALYRLTCYYDNIYRGIPPNADAPDFNNSETPMFACRFSTKQDHEHILALANEDGKLALQDTRSEKRDNQPLAGAQAHCNAIFDIAWMPDELKLVTVSGDHTAQLWDVNKGIRQLRCFHAHTRSVKTAIFRDRDKAVFATGARDGSIMVWDIRASQAKPDNCIANAHNVNAHKMKQKTVAQTSRMQSITGLVFQDDFTLISCAAGDGLLKVWDLRKNYTVHKKEPIAKHCMNYAGTSSKNGFSSLLICPAKITLYASCMDNHIYAYNVSSYNRQSVMAFYGHQNSTFYIKTCLSSDGRYLVSGSSDELAYIWHTNRPGLPLVKLHGHTEEVTCVSWYNKNDIKIVTCSDDYTYRLWTVGYEDKADNENRQISGRAEVVLENFPVGHAKLETTPTTKYANRNQEITSDSNTTPVKTPEFNNENSNHHGDRQNSFKRTYQQMMMGSEGKFNSILSPIRENREMIFTKRAYMDNSGIRRFGRENIINSSRGYDSDEPSTSQSGSIDDGILFSPTSNLPNFVLDGTAPHLLEMSPQKCKENVDWLTKIRKEKYERRMSIQKTQVTPGRRSSRSRSTEPQKVTKSARSTLLDFFKAASNDREKNPRSKNSPSTSSEDSIPSTSLGKQ